MRDICPLLRATKEKEREDGKKEISLGVLRPSFPSSPESIESLRPKGVKHCGVCLCHKSSRDFFSPSSGKEARGNSSSSDSRFVRFLELCPMHGPSASSLK